MQRSQEVFFSLYRFLAGIFNTLPDRDFIQKLTAAIPRIELLSAPLTKANRNAGKYFSAMVSDLKEMSLAGPEEFYLAFGVDRTKLTGGVHKDYGPPPPYESVYRDGNILMGPSTKKVWEAYQSSGIYHSWQEAEQAPDYLGLELEYVAALYEAESKATDQQDAARIQEMRSRFFKEHLQKWVPDYLKQVEKHGETKFFQDLSKLLSALLK